MSIVELDIIELSKNEDNLINESKRKLGDGMMLCFDILELLQTRITVNKENEIFPIFQMQVINGFLLSVMSCIRRHTVQSHLMLRYALESLVLCCYSLENYDVNFYGEKENGQFIKFDSNKVKNMAYEYIKMKYPEHSLTIKQYKDIINNIYAHPNIFSASPNITEIDDKYKGLFFDPYYDNYIRDVLLYTNDLMIMTIDFLNKLSKDFKSFKFQPNIEGQLLELSKRHNKLFLDYTFTERFRKMQNEKTFKWLTEKINKNNKYIIKK